LQLHSSLIIQLPVSCVECLLCLREAAVADAALKERCQMQSARHTRCAGGCWRRRQRLRAGGGSCMARIHMRTLASRNPPGRQLTCAPHNAEWCAQGLPMRHEFVRQPAGCMQVCRAAPGKRGRRGGDRRRRCLRCDGGIAMAGGAVSWRCLSGAARCPAFLLRPRAVLASQVVPPSSGRGRALLCHTDVVPAEFSSRLPRTSRHRAAHAALTP
jgi:hypothetical protein